MPTTFTSGPMSAPVRTPKPPPYPPLNLFALFHIFLACFGAVIFSFASLFTPANGYPPSQPRALCAAAKR